MSMTFHHLLVAALVIAPVAAQAESRIKLADVVAKGGRIEKIVEFEFGKRRVYSKDREELADIALMCRANPNVKLVVEGHAFARDEEDSIMLGEKRADIVRHLLIRYGVDPANVTAVDNSRFGEPGRYVDIIVERR
jgi:outer membrane protein OmpA-like peptidoglycan-associated protein